jgi:NADH dehydrogenase
VAIQEGRFAGRLISKELKGRSVERPFHYFDKGNMAVVGKNTRCWSGDGCAQTVS